jgi:CBS domain-containing protein
VRRLPVVNEDGRLLGLVAFDDLLDLVSDQLATLTRIVAREQAQEERERK